MATWPSALKITRESYTETPPDRVIRSQMEVGPAKTRRRSTATVRPISLKLFLTPTELETFDDFFMQNDSLIFDFTDPRTDAAVRARFVGVPSYNFNETMWEVGAKLEILP